MRVIYMSPAERNWLAVVMNFAEGRLTACQAAQRLRMTERQTFRRERLQDGATLQSSRLVLCNLGAVRPCAAFHFGC